MVFRYDESKSANETAKCINILDSIMCIKESWDLVYIYNFSILVNLVFFSKFQEILVMVSHMMTNLRLIAFPTYNILLAFG